MWSLIASVLIVIALLIVFPFCVVMSVILVPAGTLVKDQP